MQPSSVRHESRTHDNHRKRSHSDRKHTSGKTARIEELEARVRTLEQALHKTESAFIGDGFHYTALIGEAEAQIKALQQKLTEANQHRCTVFVQPEDDQKIAKLAELLTSKENEAAALAKRNGELEVELQKQRVHNLEAEQNHKRAASVLAKRKGELEGELQTHRTHCAPKLQEATQKAAVYKDEFDVLKLDYDRLIQGSEQGIVSFLKVAELERQLRDVEGENYRLKNRMKEDLEQFAKKDAEADEIIGNLETRLKRLRAENELLREQNSQIDPLQKNFASYQAQMTIQLTQAFKKHGQLEQELARLRNK